MRGWLQLNTLEISRQCWSNRLPYQKVNEIASKDYHIEEPNVKRTLAQHIGNLPSMIVESFARKPMKLLVTFMSTLYRSKCYFKTMRTSTSARRCQRHYVVASATVKTWERRHHRRGAKPVRNQFCRLQKSRGIFKWNLRTEATLESREGACDRNNTRSSQSLCALDITVSPTHARSEQRGLNFSDSISEHRRDWAAAHEYSRHQMATRNSLGVF